MGFLLSIINTFKNAGSSYGMMIVTAVIAALIAGVAWFWSRHPVRWILAALTVAILLLAFIYRGNIPGPDELDQGLPKAFMPPYFLGWVLVLSLLALYLSTHLVTTWLRARRGPESEAAAEPGKFPDLESAWEEIQIRLSRAHYDAGRQKVFLLLTPEEGLAASLLRCAGLQFFAQAPVDENAPIHAYATADGLFISCAGASSWGRSEEGAERLVALCRRIRALNPEQPVLRGMAVLYPLERATSPELIQGIGSLRNDLQTIRAELHLRCPTLAVFCSREGYAGFEEYAARIPSNVRIRRCGFSVPTTQVFERAAVLKGLSWLVQWFSTWSIQLMTDDYQDTEGNARLVMLNAQLWRDLPEICHLLDASFSTHARVEPILVRGCYFAACGPDSRHQAFTAGLVNGKASKLIADSIYTTWSETADAIDRRYRRIALALAVATAAITLPLWYFAILRPLWEGRGQHLAPFWGAASCLAALTLAWAAGLVNQWLDGKRTASPTGKS